MISYPISYAISYAIYFLRHMLPCIRGVQARGPRAGGKEVLDIHLLKPARFKAEENVFHGQWDEVVHNAEQAPSEQWLEYQYRAAHPVLRWLPSKLAEWIAENKGGAAWNRSQARSEMECSGAERHTPQQLGGVQKPKQGRGDRTPANLWRRPVGV